MNFNKDRIKYVNDELDEVVLHKPRFIHLEEVDFDTWALYLEDRDGNHIYLTLFGEVEVTDMKGQE